MTETPPTRSLLDETPAYAAYQQLLTRIHDLEAERNTAARERLQLLLDRGVQSFIEYNPSSERQRPRPLPIIDDRHIELLDGEIERLSHEIRELQAGVPEAAAQAGRELRVTLLRHQDALLEKQRAACRRMAALLSGVVDELERLEQEICHAADVESELLSLSEQLAPPVSPPPPRPKPTRIPTTITRLWGSDEPPAEPELPPGSTAVLPKTIPAGKRAPYQAAEVKVQPMHAALHRLRIRQREA